MDGGAGADDGHSGAGGGPWPSRRGPTPRRAVARSWLIGKIAVAMASLLALSLTGYAWVQYDMLGAGIDRSGALDGEAGSTNGDTNILIMGLDSRLDENGNPLPADIYAALHAGDRADGGFNSNVLMLLHVPGDGSRATAISVPRDDYVDLPGCPDQQCRGKIKQAYGLAFDQQANELIQQGLADNAARQQRARDAGRREEIDTVRQFLGGVPIDHFVEITLVAFFEIAQVVQPITVCLNENTQDSYSGADFHVGQQAINAAQAVAFVRQRRDYVHPELNFTDLDRERRQQAFIASLAYQLKQAGTLANPSKLQGILAVAKQNIAVDAGLDLLDFAAKAASLTSGNIAFVTLPIDHFGRDPAGEDVNVVDVRAVRATVRQLLGDAPPRPPLRTLPLRTLPPTTLPPTTLPPTTLPPTTLPPTTLPPTILPAAGDAPRAVMSAATVDVLNATGRIGLAGALVRTLAVRGYPSGSAGTDPRRRARTVIYYGSAASAAAQLSSLLGGVRTVHDAAVPAGRLRVVLGGDFRMPGSLAGASAPSPAAPVFGSAMPQPSGAGTLPSIGGGGIPCVK